MIGEEILQLVASKHSSSAASAAFYSRIAQWEAWWRGHDRTFHEFVENCAGRGPVRRELYRLSMAKKIAEDWATLLLNDRTAIRVEDEAGDGFIHKVLEQADFISSANRLVERAFALGTGAAILRLPDMSGGDVLPEFEFVDAAHIIPLSVKQGRITEAAFVSESVRRGEEILYIEVHKRTKTGYVIYNEFYLRDGGELVEFEDDSCPSRIETGSFVPLFSILTPNIQNNIDGCSGMGVSVYADAIDCLKGVDLAFNNFCRDIKLGGKKVFLSQSLINRDEFGNVFTPDDVAQQLFVTLGDGDFSERPMITEHNPELRVGENAEAVQSQLNYLSFRCGLGTQHYSFTNLTGRTKLTATQYTGERQDMRQMAAKHQKNLAAFLRGVVRAILWCGRELYGIDCDPMAMVQVTFDDSYFNDSETRRARDLKELEAGVITVEEYRRKWIGGDVCG